MSKVYLKTLYAKIYHENFSYTESEKRMKMQMAVYLLQEMGTPIGDYSFFWYKHGPYSQDLQNVIYIIKDMSNENTIRFSIDMEKDITRIKRLLRKPGCIAKASGQNAWHLFITYKNIFFHLEQQINKFAKNCIIENLTLIMIMKINALQRWRGNYVLN